MFTDYWPIRGLTLTTPRLRLRPPTEDDLGALADLAGRGVHDPQTMPFNVPWTDLPPQERGCSVLQHQWRLQAEWTAQRWTLGLVVVEGAAVVGYQNIRGHDFALLREVGTGSWVGLEHQGRGIGTEMRAAVLHLAFAGLGAVEATSGAFEDNPASYRVSQKLGYEDDGVRRLVVRGQVATARGLRLTRERWAERATTPVVIAGLEACLPMFGAERASRQSFIQERKT